MLAHQYLPNRGDDGMRKRKLKENNKTSNSGKGNAWKTNPWWCKQNFRRLRLKLVSVLRPCALCLCQWDGLFKFYSGNERPVLPFVCFGSIIHVRIYSMNHCTLRSTHYDSFYLDCRLSAAVAQYLKLNMQPIETIYLNEKEKYDTIFCCLTASR